MKKTYPGQSNTFIAYCMNAAIVAIVTLASAIFLSANACQGISNYHVSLTNTRLQQTHVSATIYHNAEVFTCHHAVNFKLDLFLKGTINKRPGFSKPGLI